MPELPTPGVNGQVLSAPALQASMSMLSFAPAASTSGCSTSTASAGSFCLFCENGDAGLPTLTRTSAAKAPPAALPITTDAPSSRTLMVPVTLDLLCIAVLPLLCPGNGSPLVYCYSDLPWKAHAPPTQKVGSAPGALSKNIDGCGAASDPVSHLTQRGRDLHGDGRLVFDEQDSGHRQTPRS